MSFILNVVPALVNIVRVHSIYRSKLHIMIKNPKIHLGTNEKLLSFQHAVSFDMPLAVD